MLKFLLVVLIFCAVGNAHADRNSVPLLKDKVAVDNGTCEVKGDEMVFGGRETPCVMFVGDSDDLIWFATIENGAIQKVFEWNTKTNKGKLVWKKGQVEI